MCIIWHRIESGWKDGSAKSWTCQTLITTVRLHQHLQSLHDGLRLPYLEFCCSHPRQEALVVTIKASSLCDKHTLFCWQQLSSRGFGGSVCVDHYHRAWMASSVRNPSDISVGTNADSGLSEDTHSFEKKGGRVWAGQSRPPVTRQAQSTEHWVY